MVRVALHLQLLFMGTMVAVPLCRRDKYEYDLLTRSSRQLRYPHPEMSNGKLYHTGDSID